MGEQPLQLFGVCRRETAAAGAAPAAPAAGVGPMAAVEAGPLAAVVGPDSAPPPRGKEELLRRLLHHQEVIEAVMRHGDVLPARFGTVASAGEVRRLLDCSYDRLGRELDRFAGLVQMEVSATWDLASTIAAVAAEPAIVATREAAAAAPDPAAARLALGQQVAARLAERRAEHEQWLRSTLAGLARDLQSNPLLSDELALNVAVLVERGRLGDLDAALSRFDEATGGRLQVRVVGPLPPYSFATVGVERFDAGRLRAARELLGIDGELTEAAVVAGYRRRSVRLHPDRHPGDADASARFAALAAARTDLLACCREAVPGAEPGSLLVLTVDRAAEPLGVA